MRVLSLMMVRNGGAMLQETLDRLQAYCDAAFILDDRSTDDTREIASRHPVVANVFSARDSHPQTPWYFPESMHLKLLYQMAEYDRPDWIIHLDDDQYLEPGEAVRGILAGVDPSVAALRLPLVSVWNDAEYPRLVPLMGGARSMNGAVWRFHPGLQPGDKPLHNPRLPVNVTDFGTVVDVRELTLYHQGWDTLQKRIERVDYYMSRDPEYRLNLGVPYDRGLLFGYAREEVPRLIADYRERFAASGNGHLVG